MSNNGEQPKHTKTPSKIDEYEQALVDCVADQLEFLKIEVLYRHQAYLNEEELEKLENMTDTSQNSTNVNKHQSFREAIHNMIKHISQEIVLRLKSNQNAPVKLEDDLEGVPEPAVKRFLYLQQKNRDLEFELEQKQKQISLLKGVIARRNQMLENVRKQFFAEIQLLRRQLVAEKFDTFSSKILDFTDKAACAHHAETHVTKEIENIKTQINQTKEKLLDRFRALKKQGQSLSKLQSEMQLLPLERTPRESDIKHWKSRCEKIIQQAEKLLVTEKEIQKHDKQTFTDFDDADCSLSALSLKHQITVLCQTIKKERIEHEEEMERLEQQLRSKIVDEVAAKERANVKEDMNLMKEQLQLAEKKIEECMNLIRMFQKEDDSPSELLVNALDRVGLLQEVSCCHATTNFKKDLRKRLFRHIAAGKLTIEELTKAKEDSEELTRKIIKLVQDVIALSDVEKVDAQTQVNFSTSSSEFVQTMFEEDNMENLEELERENKNTFNPAFEYKKGFRDFVKIFKWNPRKLYDRYVEQNKFIIDQLLEENDLDADSLSVRGKRIFNPYRLYVEYMVDANKKPYIQVLKKHMEEYLKLQNGKETFKRIPVSLAGMTAMINSQTRDKNFCYVCSGPCTKCDQNADKKHVVKKHLHKRKKYRFRKLESPRTMVQLSRYSVNENHERDALARKKERLNRRKRAEKLMKEREKLEETEKLYQETMILQEQDIMQQLQILDESVSHLEETRKDIPYSDFMILGPFEQLEVLLQHQEEHTMKVRHIESMIGTVEKILSHLHMRKNLLYKKRAEAIDSVLSNVENKKMATQYLNHATRLQAELLAIEKMYRHLPNINHEPEDVAEMIRQRVKQNRSVVSNIPLSSIQKDTRLPSVVK